MGEANLSLPPRAQGPDAEGPQKHALRITGLSQALEKF